MKDRIALRQDIVRMVGLPAVREEVLFSTLTTMRIGGPAALLVEPNEAEQIQNVVAYLAAHDIPWLIMGNGSNMIVSDAGFDGVVLRIGSSFGRIAVTDSSVTSQAGALLSTVAQQALQHNLTGLEFAAGIPGTLGGAVSMNAGAYDGEMSQVVVTSTCIDKLGNETILQDSAHHFGYRQSTIQSNQMVVLETRMQLIEGDHALIADKMRGFQLRRSDKQPLNLPSAGSVFRRPQGYYAGKLIEDAGLRGYRIGGAQVSEKHCGFIVNVGGATAENVMDLICHIQKTVWDAFGVQLETEVKLLGGKPLCNF